MLQAPSHLSRVCGHSHIKKFWLMQTQNESQGCENKSGLASSTSRPVPSASVKGSDSKQSPQRCGGSPSMRSLLAGASPTSRPVRPLLAAGATSSGGYGGVTGAGRHASLVTCAESLSPPLRGDPTHRSFRLSSPDLSAVHFKDDKETLEADEEEDCTPFKEPLRAGDLSASSSRCGSPSDEPDLHRFELDLVENGIAGSEPSKSLCVEPLLHSSAATSKHSGGNDAYAEGSLAADDDDDRYKLGSSSSFKTDSQAERFPQIDSQKDRFECSSSPPLATHSLEMENSDSGTDTGNFDYLRSPVRGARTFSFDKKHRSLDGRTLCNGWMPSILKGSSGKTADACEEDFPTGTREVCLDESNIGRGSVLRTCSHCGTTKTPLWRSGPHGPKSLCNACGIRFKKAKRSSVGSEGSDLGASPSICPNSTKPLSLKRKQDTLLACQSSGPRDCGSEMAVAAEGEATQHQKRSRWPTLLVKRDASGQREELTGSSGESCLTWNLHSPSSGSPSSRKFDSCVQTQTELEKLTAVDEQRTVARVFAKDEEEAAVLLMYLSCGLVYA